MRCRFRRRQMPRARLRASGPQARLPLSLSNLSQPGISDKMGSISTRMTERFGCRHPFAAAGMAFAGSTADLALGVCGGGGIGAIGVGFTPAEQLRVVIHQIRAATDGDWEEMPWLAGHIREQIEILPTLRIWRMALTRDKSHWAMSGLEGPSRAKVPAVTVLPV